MRGWKTIDASGAVVMSGLVGPTGPTGPTGAAGATAGTATFTVPTDPGTWVNQGTSTVSTGHSDVTIVGGAAGVGANFSGRVVAVTGSWTVTAFLRAAMFAKSFQSIGMCFRESSTGKLAIFDVLGVAGALLMRTTKFTTATSFSADYQTVSGAPDVLPGLWMRIADNGTNRICSFSPNGFDWVQFHSVSRTDFLTGGADQYGIGVSVENSATPNFGPVLQCLSLAKT